MKIEAAMTSWQFMLALAAWLMLEGLLDQSPFDLLCSTTVALCSLYKGVVHPRLALGASGVVQRLFCFGIGVLTGVSVIAGLVQLIAHARSPESNWFELTVGFTLLPLFGFFSLLLACVGAFSAPLSERLMVRMFRTPSSEDIRLW